ncbi:MAG TPA: endonuclease III [Rhodospirillaceae bacterium]|nr:MAG: endonuclease III [Alphaproteobacteria bacterium GWF2_58_20]HAU28504.1 endonuclease III [Rhodospirillaceae bacterium]
MTPQQVSRFFEILAQAQPDPKTELAYTNTYTLLVAVVLSAQATDKGVNKATESLFAMADTPEKMKALGEEGLKRHIHSIGLFNTKARNIMALSDILVREHGGSVPNDRQMLERLPGVGRKTANIILNVAFGHDTIAVDTHVFRVANRTGLAPGKTPTDVETVLGKVIPERFKHHAHHWLILHGRYICKAQNPACPVCPVRDLCNFTKKTPG